jgi:hypothetical protein
MMPMKIRQHKNLKNLERNCYEKYTFREVSGKQACHPQFSSRVVVKAVEEKIKDHIEKTGLGSPLAENLSVKDVISEICKCQGKFIEGSLSMSLDGICNDVQRMINIIVETSTDDSAEELKQLAHITREKDKTYRLEDPSVNS